LGKALTQLQPRRYPQLTVVTFSQLLFPLLQRMLAAKLHSTPVILAPAPELQLNMAPM
jgi:hypothetical protein